MSGVFFLAMFAVPFLSVSVTNRTVIVGALFVCVQVSWWVGVALVGPSAVSKLKGWFGARTKS